MVDPSTVFQGIAFTRHGLSSVVSPMAVAYVIAAGFLKLPDEILDCSTGGYRHACVVQ
jgi:hypothetical protein